METCLLSRQFDDPSFEAGLVHATSSSYGFFSLNSRAVGERMRQSMHPNAHLAEILQCVPQDRDVWIAQNNFRSGRNRQAVNLLSFSGAFLDFDLAKPGQCRHPWEYGRTPENRAERLIKLLDDQDVPRPSVIVHSGRGLQAKWIFDSAIPSVARPRWDALERVLCSKCEPFGADPKALLTTQILRLCGSQNMKVAGSADALVRIVWISGTDAAPKNYDFDELCEYIFPCARVSDKSGFAKWKRAKENEKTDRLKPKGWSDYLIKRVIGSTPARMLWWRRLGEIRCFLREAYPGGVKVGRRNGVLWVLGNALAWSTPDGQSFGDDLVTLCREVSPTSTPQEIRASASSVMRRLREQKVAELAGIEPGWGRGLYLFSDDGLGNALCEDDSELRAIWASIRYEGLKERQSARGRRSGVVRRRANESLVQKATEMAGAGKSQRDIANELGVPRSTVSDWIKR